MSLTTLNAISPVDGRYRRVTDQLGDYFSEAALLEVKVHLPKQSKPCASLFSQRNKVLWRRSWCEAAVHAPLGRCVGLYASSESKNMNASTASRFCTI